METTRLVPHADALWSARDIHRFMGLEFGVRSTIVLVGEDELLVYSPVELTEQLRRELDQVGQVSTVLAPNRFHHLFLGPYQEAYPEEAVWGAAGLEKKRKDLSFDGQLPGDSSVFGEELEALEIGGAASMSETVLFHRPSRTLICCDLISNFQRTSGTLTRLYFKVMGVEGRVAVSRMVRMVYRDKEAARASLEAVLAWDFERIIMAHGEVIEDSADASAKDTLRRAFSWLLKD